MFSDDGHILVVDDDSMICWGLNKIISAQGVPVTTASNGEDAIAEIASKPYDLVFLDVHLPDSNGIELMKEIKRLSPGTKVVIMTADDHETYRQKALEEGAFHFIPKPFAVPEIREVIGKLFSPKEGG